MDKIRPRHPEKVKNPVNPIKKKPAWIRSKLSDSKEFFLTKTVVNKDVIVPGAYLTEPIPKHVTNK